MKAGTCGEAANGQEAIAKARELAPDVVVLDFAMPTMNGIEAARQIHAEQPNTTISRACSGVLLVLTQSFGSFIQRTFQFFAQLLKFVAV
jgi:DNA-binding NarL/FixJ family response regulator